MKNAQWQPCYLYSEMTPIYDMYIYLTVLFKSNDKIIQWANYRKDWSDSRNPALNVVLPGLIKEKLCPNKIEFCQINYEI